MNVFLRNCASDVELTRGRQPVTSLPESLLNKARVRPVCRLVEVFERNGFEIRLVGGAVRDLVLGRAPKDFDFATDATPDQIVRLCQENGIHCVATGLRHGTLTAVIDKMNLEVTTLREDSLTDGRHAIVNFIKDWRLDAERRDLTVNALSLSLTGELYDYFGGLEDLRSGRVRFVKDARLRIREDFLRILRYFRFYGKVGTSPATEASLDPSVLHVIQQEASGLSNIAVERIWAELSQILTGNFAPSIVRIMWQRGVLAHCRFPNLSSAEMNRFEEYWHSAAAAALHPGVPLAAPAALLSAFFPDGRSCDDFCRKLRLSNQERALCCFLGSCRNPDRRAATQDGVLLRRHYRGLLVTGLGTGELAALRPRLLQLMVCQCAPPNMILEMLHWPVPAFPVNGDELRSLGLRGPCIGDAVVRLKCAWIDSDFCLTGKQLLDLALPTTTTPPEAAGGSQD